MQGALYLYIETLLSLVSGYIFWVIISRIVSAEVVGISSAVVSLSTIFATIAAIGIPSGIPRFLGKSFSEQRLDDAKRYVEVSLVWTSIGIAVCTFFILAIHSWIEQVFSISFDLILIVILLVSSTVFSTLLRAIVISSLKTRVLPITMGISTAIKIGTAAILALAGLHEHGVTIGFTLFSVIASIILAAVLANTFSRQKIRSKIGFLQSSKDILTSSIASWIPTVIYTVGAHLGPVSVFGTQGAAEAGVYFMAFAIVIAISAVTQVLFTIAFPALSGMNDGRKRFAWQLLKMSVIIALPLSSALTFYSDSIMSLFGKEYAQGGQSLSILLSSMLPIAVATGISTLAYAYGNYRQVLLIGITSNVPRTILYIMLLPIYGSIGAAMSYTIGSLIGLFVSILIAHKIGLRLAWKSIALITIIPAGIGFVLSHFGVNYIAGIIITTILSYLIFLQFGLVTRGDIDGVLRFLPYRVSNKILPIIDSFGKLRRSS